MVQDRSRVIFSGCTEMTRECEGVSILVLHHRVPRCQTVVVFVSSADECN